MKYPTTLGRELPKISSPADGLWIISEADSQIEPAVTEM